MPSSDARRALGFVAVAFAVSGFGSRAEAQQQARGFAVERFYTSAPGGGWFVMDALDMHGGLGGAMSLTTSYSRNPLRLRDGSQHLAAVSDRAFADFGFAATYERLRLYLDMGVPLVTKGENGTVGAYRFSGPVVDLGENPDTLSDVRIGIDARILGNARSPVRLGAGAQLFVPSGHRSEYDTDDTYRAMGRLLLAGDGALFTYAGQAGVHLRPVDASSTLEGPQGNEFLFGVAGGVKTSVFGGGTTSLIVGPEIYGATAFRSLFGATDSAIEGLATGRIEGTADDGRQLRVKLGAGGGIYSHFGAPEWRLVFAIELFDHHAGGGTDQGARPGAPH